MKVNAIIMHVLDVWINCNAGYLRFQDKNGFACGLCEEVDEPSHFCQIYVEENACTEEEIWKAVVNHYPFCTRSVIHRGASNLTVHLVTLGASWREFTLEYTLFECKGSTSPTIQALGIGPPLTDRHNTASALEYNCPIIVKPKETTTEQTAVKNMTSYGATTPTSVMKQVAKSTTSDGYNIENSASYSPTMSHARPTSQSSNAVEFTSRHAAVGNPPVERRQETMTTLAYNATSPTKPRSNEGLLATTVTTRILQNSTDRYPLPDKFSTSPIQVVSQTNQTENTGTTNTAYDAATSMGDLDVINSKNQARKDLDRVRLDGNNTLRTCWIIVIILAVLLLISILTIICLLVRRRKHTKKYHPSKIVKADNTSV